MMGRRVVAVKTTEPSQTLRSCREALAQDPEQHLKDAAEWTARSLAEGAERKRREEAERQRRQLRGLPAPPGTRLSAPS